MLVRRRVVTLLIGLGHNSHACSSSVVLTSRARASLEINPVGHAGLEYSLER